jgi:hypothetical protein
MKFFLPFAKDATAAEQNYAVIKARAERDAGRPVLPDRYYAIDYIQNGNAIHNEVGEEDPQTREMVFAIFRVADGGPFLVCTTDRGVRSGSAMLASGDATATLFDV